jgi:hypothetical protein
VQCVLVVSPIWKPVHDSSAGAHVQPAPPGQFGTVVGSKSQGQQSGQLAGQYTPFQPDCSTTHCAQAAVSPSVTVTHCDSQSLGSAAWQGPAGGAQASAHFAA